MNFFYYGNIFFFLGGGGGGTAKGEGSGARVSDSCGGGGLE